MHAVRRLGNLALAASLLGWAGVAGATPVVHTVIAGSSLTGQVQGTLSFQLFTNLGTQNGTANATGNLSSTPNGSITVDWGAPNWSGDLALSPGGVAVNNPNPGTATGNAVVNLFGFLNVNFGLSIPITNIALGLASSANTTLNPIEVSPGGGPWTGAYPSLDVTIGATGTFDATGPFGINIGGPLNIAATSVGGIPVMGNLSRVGGNPGTGTEISIPISGLNLTLPPGATTNILTPGCEVSIIGCALNVTSVNVTLTSLKFLNVNGNLIARSTSVIPEPTTALLLGVGLAGLSVVRRRRAE